MAFPIEAFFPTMILAAIYTGMDANIHAINNININTVKGGTVQTINGGGM